MISGRACRRSRVFSCLALVVLAACGVPRARPAVPSTPDVDTPLPLAFMVGEVSTAAATLWVRCADAEEVVLNLAPGDRQEVRFPIDRDRDETARIALTDLEPDTAYRYTLWCRGGALRAPGGGSFRTAPLPDAREAVRFAWAGDVGGQNVCRDRDQGYLPFRAVRATLPDFFIALGDMMYADDACLPEGRYGNPQVAGPETPAAEVDEFRAHWRYARADAPTQQFFATTAVYPIWDDHEIVNDAGPHHAAPPGNAKRSLLAPARQAFLDYHPFAAAAEDVPPLYRSVRWGRHLEVFILDTRSYRDSNRTPDGPNKSLLGPAQAAWLRDALMRSDATWKVIVSSVPIAVPTGAPGARDGWANFDGNTGFEAELTEILRTVQRLVRRQTLWITTDVHFGSALRYVPFPEDPDFVFHEVITGPLNAGIFPNRELDGTFHPERLYFHGPERAEDVTEYVDALRWFNFGTVEIDAAGTLTLRIVTALGEPVFERQLQP